MKEALECLHFDHGPTLNREFRDACNFIAVHLYQLPYRIFFELPGGHAGNENPAWAVVKRASWPNCGCGNERFFEPVYPRLDFEPSTGEPVVITPEDPVYFKPRGSTKASAYALMAVTEFAGMPVCMRIVDPIVQHDIGPYNPPQAFSLIALAELLAVSDHTLVLVAKLKSVQPVPMLAFSDVDPFAGTLTVILDEDVECFRLQPAPAGS